MKLKFYNTENCKQGRSGAPSIRVVASGRLGINKSACDLLEIKGGDKVEIVKDEEENKWYIFKSSSDNGFKLRGDANKTGLSFNSSILSNAILKSLVEHKSSIALPISESKVHHNSLLLYPIITTAIANDN